MRTGSVLVWVCAIWCGALPLGAAEPRPLPQDEEEFFEVFEEPPQAAANAPAAASTAPATPSARAKLLAKLKFDRRPSAILALRAKPAGASDAPAAGGASASGTAGAEGAGIEGGGVEGVIVSGGRSISVTTTTSGTSTTVVHAIGGPASAGAAPAAPVAPAASVAPGSEGAGESAEPAAEGAEAPSDPEAAAKAAAAAEAKKAEQAALEAEMSALQRNVTLGEWAQVQSYLAGLDEADGKAGYERLLASLIEGPPRPQGQFANWAERNFFAVEDIAALVAAAPTTLDKARITALGTLARQCADTTGLVEPLIACLRSALGEERLGVTRTELAAILIAAGWALQAGEFLPPLEEARGADERGTLNLIALHCLARHEKEKKGGWLEQAWYALQAVLASGKVSDEDKNEALQRAVELAPRLEDELGAAWLAESFTTRPERGLEIVAAIGASASTGLMQQARNSDYRQKSLTLQTTAVEALLREAPALAGSWGDTLTLLAGNWLREGEYSYQFDSSTSRGPSYQRDAYGNIYYYNWGQQNNPNQPMALKTADVLRHQPSQAWLAHVGSGLRARIERALAQLHLKLGEEQEAFPHIERLAQLHPQHARELAEEFLRVWTKNHNPNDQQQRTNQYMFMYGFEERLNGIPLTRSKQERNLVELAGWITRLRALPIEAIDEQLLARAFTSAHSSAEVYRLETIERVFGAFGTLGPKTIAELVQTMRANLAGVWRKPAEQEDKKTRRRPADIQSEVLRGYEVADAVLARALAEHAGDWGLLLARAAVLHDENDYRAELARSSEFVPRRAEALAAFHQAAAAYAAALPELDAAEQSTRVHELWFYAALGACDLNALDHEKLTVEGEMPLIRAAIDALPGEAAKRHADFFANALFTRLSSVAPAVKYRYLRHGLEIVPNSERTRDARAVFEYYRDLVTEIRLQARLEGEPQVGQEPFGVFVELQHTREIEREAGGFGKYLVNQNAQNFSWNYGRPTEDYRDKFEQAARAALGEHFEVLSVTFNSPEAHSRALAEYGWRVTPYAYLLLKARSPAVDRLPPLRFDLDFLDTSGYAVLPIESPPVALDATRATVRPFEALRLVQTLDERQAAEHKLVLEVQARARGLVPALGELLDLAPPGFVLGEVEDQGVAVAQFDAEAEGVEVLSERTWLLTLRGAQGLAELPEEFHFGTPRVASKELAYQRFVDADLAAVEPVVALERRYGQRATRWSWGWPVALLVLAVGGFAGLSVLRQRRRTAQPSARFRVPEPATAFTVLGLLREIGAGAGLSAAEQAELEQAIVALERRYFEREEGAEPDLAALAADWVRRAS